MAEPSAESTASNPLPMTIEVGQATSVGQVRSGNEDSVLCEPVDAPTVRERGLFCAVADGMGGHAAGEVASDMAVRKARDAYYRAAGDVEVALEQAIKKANSDVFSAGASKQGREHMGSTLTALVLYGGRAVVGHVGDSRCYVVTGDEIRQITRDHSWVAQEVEAGTITPEEARVHPRRNIITRALGLKPGVEVDIYETPVTEGSIFVLCSDGLHGPVNDEEIRDYASRLPPQRAVEAMISLANERGGLDNISAIVVRVGGPATPRVSPGHVADDRPTPTTIKVVSTPSQVATQADAPFPVPSPEPADPDDSPTPLPAEGEEIAAGSGRGSAMTVIALALLVAALVGAAIGALVFFGWM